MNLERTKPETLAAGVMDYMPSQSAVAHEYAERLNAALARLGLTDRLTLPPAPNTAIDELPGVVDVPLRKTLSVLMGKAQQGDASALATLEWTAQVAESIFAGLHARDFTGDRPLALPSHESLATLSQGVDALLPRKISNGAWSLLSDGTPSDGIDDGVSLVRLLCSSAADSVTELKDDNEGWVMNKANTCNILYNTFPNASMVVLNCLHIKADPFTANNTVASGELHFSKAESIVEHSNTNNNTPNLDVYMDALKTSNITNNGQGIFCSRKIFLPVYKRGAWRVAGSAGWGNTITQYIYIGCKGEKTDTIRCWAYDGGQDQAKKLLDVEIREGACQNLTFDGLKHLTAENIYNHILCRLKQDEPMCGEGVTITLGTTNIDKIEAVEEYNLKLTELTDIYGYTFA